MTLEELGAALRAERERRRLNLEDVASRLKIPIRMLRALEDGDTASLPHLAYAKGFIRSYALFLGMVAEEVSEAADVIGDNIVKPKPAEIPVPSPAKSSPVNPLRVILAIIAIALFAVAGLSAWQPDLAERMTTMVRDKISEMPVPRVMPAEEIASLEGVQNKNSSVKQSPAKTEKSTSAGSGNAVGTAGQNNSGNGMPIQSATALDRQDRKIEKADNTDIADMGRQNSRKAGVASVSESSGSEQKPASQQVAVRPSADGKNQGLSEKPVRMAGAVSGAGGPHAGLHRLILTATEACSVQSRADGTQNRQFALRRGDTFALMFVKSLEVRIGNVKAVRLRYDGKDVDLADGPLTRTLQFPLVEGQ